MADCFRSHQDIVLAAVAQNAKAFLHAPEELRTDRDFVLAVVEKNFLALAAEAELAALRRK